MKRILFIAPSSYPVLGAEGIVNIKLLKTLTCNDDYCIDLVSKRNKWSNYPSRDISNYNVKLNSINIIEVDNVVNTSTILGHINSFFRFGVVFKGCHWAYSALSVVKDLCRNNRYDCIMTKNESSFLLGYYLKRKYNLKWIATWNDPYPEDVRPEPYGEGLKRVRRYPNNRIIKIMQHADVHIFPNERLRNYMLTYLNVSEDRTCIIPHVMHDTGIVLHPKYSKKLKLIHSGNISYPRDPRNFLLAFKKFIEEITTDVELTILGVVDSHFTSLLQEIGIMEYVKIIPPVSYDESLLLLADYHVAIIIEAICSEGIYLPTKVSDFMQQRKHIFAISPSEGILNDLFRKGKIKYFANNMEVESIFESLTKIFDDFNKGNLNIISTDFDESFAENSILKKYSVLV